MIAAAGTAAEMSVAAAETDAVTGERIVAGGVRRLVAATGDAPSPATATGDAPSPATVRGKEPAHRQSAGTDAPSPVTAREKDPVPPRNPAAAPRRAHQG